MNIKLSANRIANNGASRKKVLVTPILDKKIRELELSINNQCNLSCVGCGFNIPTQLEHSEGRGIAQHLSTLQQLKAIGVRAQKIVVVGGEAALSRHLSKYLNSLRDLAFSDEIELVTNGLYPKGITSGVLKSIDRLVISDYVKTQRFEFLWRDYLDTKQFTGGIDFRRKDAWDDLISEVNIPAHLVEAHWQTCFYRKYDVTLERGRLFSCSRIAKKGWDNQGLLINDETSATNVIEYLTSKAPKEACYSCATVTQTSQIPVATQRHINLDSVIEKAEQYLCDRSKQDEQ